MLNGRHTITWWCKSKLASHSLRARRSSIPHSKGAIEGLNSQRLANDSGHDPSLELKTDASATRGVIMRQGVGEIRHLHVNQLWLQETVVAGDLVITKIPRRENLPDAFTYPWTSADLQFWNAMGLRSIPPPHQTPIWPGEGG